ncbi:zinc ribbon domain-containing protein [Streptomyces sp. P9(2023)]|uniref:NADase-type glycan-binding domain-containing protein n=1 Tax=Streptomyces sp. P9(2023) TaxID=3064394 RepID=UPI0028F422EA|nr:zinc ribbon domain-containing protein [Streptomyces sp. P9(2023)]MDT9689853.1 zinc ribbon domain-containing protein [Streptomyces sp. P9(2023)]
MRTCQDCGTANGDTDDFCGNCGAYVGWAQEEETAKEKHREQDRDRDRERRRAEEEPAEETPGLQFPSPLAAAPELPTQIPSQLLPDLPVDIPAEPQTGFLRGILRGFQSELPPELTPDISIDIAAPTNEPDATNEPDSEPQQTSRRRPASPPPPAPIAPPKPTHSPTNGPTPSPVPPRTPTPIPTPRPQPEEPPVGAVGAVKPAKPIAQRPKVRRGAEDEPQDGLPCPACGTRNARGRRFCRRCATPLSQAAPAAPLPWWRTVWPFRRRVRSGSGQFLRRLIIVLVLLGLVVGGYFLIPAGRWLYEDVRDKLGKATPITAQSVEASASVPKHGAALATDGLSNTYWGAPKVGDSLNFTFRSPFRLVDVVVHTGTSKKAETFRSQARPIRADLLVTAEDGKTHKKTITLADKPGPQTIQTGYSDVVSVQLTLHEATGLSEGRHLAVAEVEFFKRS